jgi:hypothetical protein
VHLLFILILWYIIKINTGTEQEENKRKKSPKLEEDKTHGQ